MAQPQLARLLSGILPVDRFNDDLIQKLNAWWRLGTNLIQGKAVPVPGDGNDGQVLQWSRGAGSFLFATVAGVVALASETVAGLSKLSVAPASPTNPVAVGDNDPRNSDARTPTAHASTHATAGTDPVTLDESQITNLTTDLASKVPNTRNVIAGTGLTGGGTLGSDIILSLSGSTGWSTAYEVDLTTQTTQDFKAGGDGAYTIDGKTWTVANSAQSSVFKLTNGTGLVITTNTAGTAKPSLFGLLSSLAASINVFRDEVIVWAWVTPSGVTTNSSIIGVGLGVGPNANAWKLVQGLEFNSGSAAWLVTAESAEGLTGTFGPHTTTNLSDETHALRLLDPLTGAAYSGAAWSTTWPAWDSLHRRGTVSVPTITNNGSAVDPDPSAVGALFYVTNTAGSGPPSVTIKRLRIDVRQ